jgi:hypothetical protein
VTAAPTTAMAVAESMFRVKRMHRVYVDCEGKEEPIGLCRPAESGKNGTEGRTRGGGAEQTRRGQNHVAKADLHTRFFSPLRTF